MASTLSYHPTASPKVVCEDAETTLWASRVSSTKTTGELPRNNQLASPPLSVSVSGPR